MKFVLGLFLGLTATMCATLNKIAWKLGHNLTAMNETVRKAYIAYTLGSVALIVNPPLDMLSLYYAPQTLFAAIAGTGTVFNIIMAKIVLGEEPSKLDIFGAIAVCIGCSGIALAEVGLVLPEYTYDGVRAGKACSTCIQARLLLCNSLCLSTRRSYSDSNTPMLLAS